MIKEPWKQPRFQDPVDCFLRPLLEDKNDWHFVELEVRDGTDEEELDEEGMSPLLWPAALKLATLEHLPLSREAPKGVEKKVIVLLSLLGCPELSRET